MATTLDGEILFDEQQLEILPRSLKRASAERTIAGVDGVLSIDLGFRGRKIIQKGTLRAKSRPQMSSRIAAISAYMDGNTHKLVTSDNQTFDNLRMDSFKVFNDRVSGSGICCDYEIVYMQLVV